MKEISILILAYLLGSIPSGLWIGKVFFNINLREHGSGNTGTTNTFRILGKKAGIIVFAIDLLKGTLAVLLPTFFGIQGISPMVFGLLAVLGHTFPIFAGFKGGKAVATSAGMLLAFAPLFFFYSLTFFLIVLYITSMVSAASIASAIFVTLSSIILPFIWPTILPTFNLLLTVICFALTCYIVYRHRENIQRIKAGNENRVSFGLNKKVK